MSGPATDPAQIEFAHIEPAVADIAGGKMVVVVGEIDRYAEGYLVMAAEAVTPEALSFMRRRGGGWIGLALTRERFEELRLRPTSAKPDIPDRGRLTATIDAREQITTGVSVHDQARTIRTAADPTKGARDIVAGGHVHALEAHPRGVLERASHAEASVDLARLAGVVPAGLVCAIENPDGSIARPQDLVGYCRRQGLKMIAIADLIAYRYRSDKPVERAVETTLPTAFGTFLAVGYPLGSDRIVLALVRGEVRGRDDVLVGIHKHSVLRNVFHSLHYDTARGIDASLEAIERQGQGVVVYLPADDGELSLPTELAPSDQGDAARPPTPDQALDSRDYVIAAQILIDLGVSSASLLRGDRNAIEALETVGLPAVPATSRDAARPARPTAASRGMSSPMKGRVGRTPPGSTIGRPDAAERGLIRAGR